MNWLLHLTRHMAGTIRKGSFRLVGDQAGTAIIETALALPVTIVLIGGAFEFGRYYWTQNSMQLAVEETARYIMVTGTTNQLTLQTYLRNRVEAGTAASVSVSVSTETSGTMSYTTVSAQYSFQSTLSAFIPSLGTRQIQVRVKVPVIS